MPPSIDARIRARIEELTPELSVLVHQAALEAVQEALGGPGDAPVRRGPGRPRKAKAARKKPGRRPGRARVAKAKKAARKTARKAAKRVRRSAEDLEALAAKVLAYVRSNAGHRLEQISAGLKIASKDLKRCGSRKPRHTVPRPFRRPSDRCDGGRRGRVWRRPRRVSRGTPWDVARANRQPAPGGTGPRCSRRRTPRAAGGRAAPPSRSRGRGTRGGGCRSSVPRARSSGEPGRRSPTGASGVGGSRRRRPRRVQRHTRRQPRRCQPTTVAGRTMSRQPFQPDHARRNATQNRRS